jgi:hypothetical protein
MSLVPYASDAGSWIYATNYTRPDIAHSVGDLSRYMSKPGKESWTSVKKVLRYFHRTINYGIFDQERLATDKALYIHEFVDACLTGDLDHRIYTSGYVFNLFGGVINWMSNIQYIVALSIA